MPEQPIEVLVVDEDPELLTLTETFLEREHDRIAVRTETNPERAIDLVAGEAIDCVVSDFRMPRMDGIELFERLRAEGLEVPFFLFTAADRQVESRAEDAGVTGYVQKGSGTDHYTELVTRIEAAVEQATRN
jgi:CheY-like chemotaxis protein